MTKITLDLDVLRSFATGMDLGSFAKAADRLGRSTSAVSAQLKKLEEQTGAELFRKAGRGLALTEAGETLLAYARRLLDLNDEAASALHDMTAEGWLRIGMQEEFCDLLLPKVLGPFGRAHPKLRIEARVARNTELLDRVSRGQLDFALAWYDGAQTGHRQDIATLPMRWIGPSDASVCRVRENDPLPLVSYEDACRFRAIGTAALDRADRPWRIALTSPTLGGLWAGIAAGFGLTIRTKLGLPATVRPFDCAETGLPELPTIGLALYRKDAVLDPAGEKLVALVLDEVLAAI